MYFPYVFGRQSELLALRGANKSYVASGRIVPIIEPVAVKPDAVVRCLTQLGETAAKAILIVNPTQGEFKESIPKNWKTEVDAVLAKHNSLIPAFKCGPQTTLAAVSSFISSHPGRSVALMYHSPALSDAEIHSLAKNPSVAFHVTLQGKTTAAQRALLPKAKAVDIFDRFNKQERNADYSGKEPFSDHHRTYKSVGVGFGDYTVTGSDFSPGGGKPAAIAIHATYKNPNDQNVWVEHFVSDDTNLNTGSAESKYHEAVAKLVPTTARRKVEFGTNSALEAYAIDHRTGSYPGLGKNKERQIFHHIALMHDLLHGKI